MNSTAIGTSSGSAQRQQAGRRVEASAGRPAPVAVIAAAESIRPTSIEPESPMKIRAGLKLCGRKPRQAPTSTAVISAGALATSW